jgi:hypothetical protein
LLQRAAAAAGMLPESSGGRSASSSDMGSRVDDAADVESGSLAGGACPQLMMHLAVELQRQLSDPAGHINKQVTDTHKLMTRFACVTNSAFSCCSFVGSCAGQHKLCRRC